MPVVVKFGAKWCGPCRAMESQLASLEQTLPGRVQVVQIDTDERPELAHHYGVRGIPRTFLLSGGTVVDDRVGYLSSRELEAWVQPWLH
jgi:thioredoxin-like negative regulator of GroEL